jgi:hypothetical protein
MADAGFSGKAVLIMRKDCMIPECDKSVPDVHIIYGFCHGIAGVVLKVSRWEVSEQMHSC